jgi:hypothetical protein
MPEPHAGAAYGVIAGKIYIEGGNVAANEIDIYDPIANTWTTGAGDPFQPASPAGGVIDGKLYVAGGNSVTQGGTRAEMEVYDPTTNSWSSAAPMPSPVSSAAAGVIDGKLYVAGGVQQGGEVGPFMNTVQVYDPATNTWAIKQSMPARLGYLDDNGAVINGLLYVAGGADSNGNAANTLEVYDPSTDTWTTKAPMPTARLSAGVAELGGILYVAGGRATDVNHQDVLSTVESYDPSTDVWTNEPSLPTLRNAPIAIGLNGVLYVAGGNDVPGHESGDNSVDAFTPTSAAIPVTINVMPSSATYTGVPYLESNITSTLTPNTAEGAITYSFFSDAAGSIPISDPTHAGTYYVQGHFTSSDPVQWTNADSLITSFTIKQATLSALAETQNALNIAKQGYMNVDISSISGIVGSDTIASVFGSMTFQLTIGANVYTFQPTVTVVSSIEVNVAYALKGGTGAADALRTDLALIDLGATSASNAKYETLWISAQNQDYSLVDDFFTRLFSSMK